MMNRIEFIDGQNKTTRSFVKGFIDRVPEEKWFIKPAGLETTMAWQVGHLVISQYFHSIAVITGSRKSVSEVVSLRQYSENYAFSTVPSENPEGQPTIQELKQHLDFMGDEVHSVLMSLNDADLDSELHPTKFPHPIAKTKWDALTFSYRHEMWHGGQIAMLKRELKKY